MFTIKPISRDSIPNALEKAERYRLLNEPMLAESICLDILDTDPGNTRAIVIMLLAVTDQFGTSMSDMGRAKELLTQITDPYELQYYSGIVCERQGKTKVGNFMPDGGSVGYEWLRDAMEFYEKAEAIRPTGKDEAILRWNTCARLIMRHNLKPRNETYVEQPLE